MDRQPLQLALRDLQASFGTPRALLGMAVVILVLGLSGPFGTFAAMGLAQRLAYWFAIVVLTFAAGRVTTTIAGALLRDRLPSRPLLVVVEGICCGVTVTLVVIAINALVFNDNGGISPLLLWGYCTAISIGVLVVLSILVPDPPPAPVAMPPDAPPAILERLPHPQRGRLVALSVRDHYVEVVTDRGRSLVLMRLSDAIRETGAVAGLQIHRSHWVALDAIGRVVKADGRVSVELKTGERLPVSRGYLPAARQAGLLV